MTRSDAPAALLVSAEAEVFPLHHPGLADLIDGSIAEGSAFHELYGYYAQGAGERTATLPKGWRDRLVRLFNPNTNGVCGLCLEVHDLAISKHVAGREKDAGFTRELARQRMTDGKTLLERLEETDVTPAQRELIATRIRRDTTQRK